MRCDPTETRAVHRLKQQSRGPANGSAEGFVRALAGARRRQGDAHAAGEWWAGSGRRLVVEGERVESDEKTTIRRLGSRARCKPQSIRDRVASQVGPPFGIVTPLGLPFWRANCSSPSAPGRAPQSGRFLGKRREVNREEIALRCAARVQEPVHIARIDFCRRCGDMTGQ